MLNYVILGIIQGLTEFFPVSSSGHLVVMRHLLGLGEDAIRLVVWLHVGTFLALFLFFYRQIIKMLSDKRMLFLVGIVTLVTGIMGLVIKRFLPGIFTNIYFVLAGWLITGVILIFFAKQEGRKENLTLPDAFWLGVVQGCAVLPGISRSAATLVFLLKKGITPPLSFELSFLVALPAVFLAGLLEIVEAGVFCIHKGVYLAVVISFLCGLLSLLVLRKAVIKARLHYFGYYCIGLALFLGPLLLIIKK